MCCSFPTSLQWWISLEIPGGIAGTLESQKPPREGAGLGLVFGRHAGRIMRPPRATLATVRGFATGVLSGRSCCGMLNP